MPLPSSGPILLSAIQAEFGGSANTRLSEYYRGGLYVTPNNLSIPVSGVIKFSDFRGTFRQFSFVNNSNLSTPQNLRSMALAAGWNGSDAVLFTNNAIISSDTTASPALTVNGSFPNGVTLVNNSYIVGMGGAGGWGSDAAQPGFAGGAAVGVSSSVSISNSGVLAGGGGGGGAGVQWGWNGYNRSSPGSGGASGFSPALQGYTVGNVWSERGIQAYPSQGPDSLGLYSTPGPAFNWGWGGRASSPGGKGGSWGSAGDAGGTVDGNYNYSGYAGGAGGAAVTGNSNVTWITTGTRYGALV